MKAEWVDGFEIRVTAEKGETVISANREGMAVLETQSYNFKAISFYKKNGFQIIGFDRYAYSNRGPEEHNMRIEMGKKLQD